MTLYANGGGNRGCQALAYTIVFVIDKIMKKYREDYTLYLPDDHSPDYGINEIEINGSSYKYYKCDYPFSYKTTKTIGILLRQKKFISDLRIFCQADYIFDIGQGDSFSDIYGNERYKSITLIQRLAFIFKKKFYLLPQTIGPFNGHRNKKDALTLLNRASFIMTRDRNSLQYSLDIGLRHDRIKDYIDVAFMLPYKKSSFASEKVKIGINVSALLWNGGYTKNNQFHLGVNYKECIRSIIERFVGDPKNDVFLVPHVVSADKDVENDYYISSNLVNEYSKKNLHLSPFFLDPIEAKNYISALDFFIGARMHSTIASFSSGVPTIPMSYSRKFDGLFKDTLGYNYIVDLKEKRDIDDIMNFIDSAFANKEEIRNVISEINSTIVDRECKNIINQMESFLVDDKNNIK